MGADVVDAAHNGGDCPGAILNRRERPLGVQAGAARFTGNEFHAHRLPAADRAAQTLGQGRGLLRRDQLGQGPPDDLAEIVGEEAGKSWIDPLDDPVCVGEQNDIAGVVEDRLEALFGLVQLGGTLFNARFQHIRMAANLVVKPCVVQRGRRAVGEGFERLGVMLVIEVGGGARHVQKADHFTVQADRSAGPRAALTVPWAVVPGADGRRIADDQRLACFRHRAQGRRFADDEAQTGDPVCCAALLIAAMTDHVGDAFFHQHDVGEVVRDDLPDVGQNAVEDLLKVQGAVDGYHRVRQRLDQGALFALGSLDLLAGGDVGDDGHDARDGPALVVDRGGGNADLKGRAIFALAD